MAKRKPRKYAFVPRLLVRTAIVGVVPACALGAIDGCGGSTSTPSKDAGHDVFQGVAAVAYPAYESGVPETGGGEAGSQESGADSGIKDTGLPEIFGVAAVAYPAYEAGPG